MKATQSAITTSIVDAADARAYLRIDGNAFDAELELAIAAATAYVEGETESTIALRSVVAVEYGSAPTFSIPLGPVVSVTSVIDAEAETPAFTLRHYGTDTKLTIDDSFTAPLIVTYQAGYATPPADLKIAILELVASMHRFKEPIITGTIVAELPQRGKNIINKYRRNSFVG